MGYSIRERHRRQLFSSGANGRSFNRFVFILSLWISGIFVAMAGRSTCLGQAAESADQLDNSPVAEPGFLIEHPFFPHRVELSFDGNRCLILRDDPVAGSQTRRTQLAILDLVDRETSAQKIFDGTAKHVSIGTEYVCVVWESQVLSVLAAGSLETLAEVTLPKTPIGLTNVADQLVVAGQDRWKLPTLKPQESIRRTNLTKYRSNYRIVTQQTKRARGGWSNGVLVYKDDLKTPIRFDELFTHSIINRAAYAVDDSSRRRLSYGYNILASLDATTERPWVFQIAAAATKALPVPASVVPLAPSPVLKPEQLRFQILDANTRSRRSNHLGRLLATIPIEANGRIDLRRILPKRPLMMSGNSCVASMGMHLVVVRISQPYLDSLSRPPMLVSEDVPLVASWGSSVEWRLRTNSNVEIVSIQDIGTGDFISFDRATQSLIFNIDKRKDGRPRRIDTYLRISVKEENLTFESLKSDLRESYGDLWPALESYTGRSFSGVPLIVPYAFSALCADGSVAVHNSAIIVDLPDGRLSGHVDGIKAIELARVKAYEERRAAGIRRQAEIRAEKEKRAAAIEAQERERLRYFEQAKSLARKASSSPESSPPPDPADKPLTAHEVPAPVQKPNQPIWISRIPQKVKTGINGVLFVVAGSIFLRMSFCLFNASCDEGTQQKTPSFVASLLLMAVLAVPIVHAESQALLWVESGVNSGWSGLWSFGILLVSAFLLRMLVIGVVVSGVYQLKREHIREVMTLFASFAYIVGAMFAGVLGAVSYGVSLL